MKIPKTISSVDHDEGFREAQRQFDERSFTKSQYKELSHWLRSWHRRVKYGTPVGLTGV